MSVQNPSRLLAALVTVMGLGACASMGNAPMAFSQTNLPDAVKVPAGHAVVMETAAAGDITYECRAKKDMAGQFEWVFVGPDAGLRDRSGNVVGRYFGPPARHMGKPRRLQSHRCPVGSCAIRLWQHPVPAGQGQSGHGLGCHAGCDLHSARGHAGRCCAVRPL